MKKNSLLIIVGIVVIIILAIVFIVINKNVSPEDTNGVPTNEIPSEIEGATEIILNEETDINPLKNIQIAGTNDYFSITDDLKDTFSSGFGSGSFSFNLPYKFIIDGSEFQGNFIISSNSSSYENEDDNPKYDVELRNFSVNNGIFTVLINEK